ncbi:MAG: gas vesicle protein K [Thaumarchaeota archaeon]|nr:MAG: gas vesicle protein K [Nitrososphaerota archaeon]TLX94603.1 MAG: gas vesicle protein K [Nitrososphaerota archaeon]
MASYAKISPPSSPNLQQVSTDGGRLQNGLARLILAVVELLRQLLERQAQRRVLAGTLSAEEIERLGLAFMQIKRKIHEISDQFGLSSNELDIKVGSIITKNSSATKASLVDVLDKLLDKGTVVGGQVTISVADIDLIALDLFAVLSLVHDEVESSSKKKVRNHDC